LIDEKSTERTICLCSNVCNSAPVFASHNFAVKSEPAVAANSAFPVIVAPHTAPL